MICPKCQQSFQGSPERCPHCGAYFVDGFTKRLHEMTPLKKAVQIVSLSWMGISTIALLVLSFFLIGLTPESGARFFGLLGGIIGVLLHLIFATIIFFKNKIDDILSPANTIVWGILNLIIGSIPLGILFLCRCADSRKRLEGDKDKNLSLVETAPNEENTTHG